MVFPRLPPGTEPPASAFSDAGVPRTNGPVLRSLVALVVPPTEPVAGLTSLEFFPPRTGESGTVPPSLLSACRWCRDGEALALLPPTRVCTRGSDHVKNGRFSRV